ncbi:alkanesulfonate monooxygenase SsuD/methylene tetrahydromethanopterin reductase-like flavin-dependent oxidoreductase (luciferase family) [Nakamurella sp. UYEF19]|uniref:LLM class flavin-dependent oxidoreductase n=1 Tax=Nakamurella sp. UYEF19 TaxID=1756392 RepID=UPI00339777D5
MTASSERVTAGPGLRSALWLPLVDELADPSLVARLAADAEAAGWDGVFVWDQLSWSAPVSRIADPWITLAAIAAATERVRIGPMVTPLARRRPTKLARETVTLDRLSGGRLTLGVGVGSDRFAREFSRTGEQPDDRIRAEMLDEGLKILAKAWSGEPVRHRGRHYVVDDLLLLPKPAQRPGVPVWAGGLPGHVKPMRRAAGLDGFVPANLTDSEQLAEIVFTIKALRRPDATAFDFAVALPVGVDPQPFAAAGATWWLPEFEPGVRLDLVLGFLRDGPADREV